MSQYDLLIKNGDLIIPARQQRGRCDVAIAQGRIAALASSIPAEKAARVVDASGKLVAPGLIDLHTHLGFEVHTRVIDPNQVCPPAGVTTAIDMGSTGAFTFPWYRERVLKRTVTRLFEFLNIASLGTISIHTPYYVENYGRYIDVAEALRTIEENREHIRGIKVFASSAMVGQWALEAIRTAVQVGERAGLPIAIHVSDAPPPLDEILALMRPGDILTHSYTPHDQGILDSTGKLKPAVIEARQRGVLFDIGHGAGSFSFEVARRALEQGFVPDTISTDVYYMNIESPVKDLPTTISKFLNLGMSLEDALARVTCNPARAIREPSLGTLEVGGPADLVVLNLQRGEFSFLDVLGQTLQGEWLLQCDMTICRGKPVFERSAS